MNLTKNKWAYEYLELEQKTKLDYKTIKKQYHIKALKYHPDKNKNDNATEEFQKIQKAYNIILEEQGHKNNNNIQFESNYKDVLLSFLNKIIDGDSILNTIIQNILLKYENTSLDMLKNLDKSILFKIHNILSKYKDILNINENYLNDIHQIIINKNLKDECIILNPNLNDLLSNNLYRLTHNDKQYIIPLWHHELVYDLSDSDLYVKTYPNLKDNMEINRDNNLFIRERVYIKDVWNKDIIYFNYENISLPVTVSTLKLKEEQTIIFSNMGVTKINTSDIYNINKKGDIYLIITLII